MQTIFIEENINHEQVENLCKFIEYQPCKSLEFRRCKILDSDFDELMKSLSKNGESIVSLIFNIQMIKEKKRFKRFTQMLSHCSNLINLRVHGNDIDDDMFTQLFLSLHENCYQLSLLDIGDNKLTNKSMSNICSLIVPDENKTGLEELILSANRLITNAGWTELFFSIAFSSRIRRLAFDYNIFDNSTAAMLSMLIASSRTLTYLDLECCSLTEFAGKLFLALFTKYPVTLEEICLDQNPLMLNSTCTLINECLGLKSRSNSISSHQPLSYYLPIDDDASVIASKISEKNSPVKLRRKKRKPDTNRSSKVVVKEETKPFTLNEIKVPEKRVEIRNKENKEQEYIEELLPIEPQAYGTVGRLPYWQRL
ncbi:unnamed protein product [Rotaria magnacalcarata]|uniref:Uncharacterized protein n=1 Tax=Rotaria magnacalcarata TaxID=392030 RepID=A0A819YAR9_9BILA|nr:unnamed protein product [Rotaria magnacalcarata]CAF2132241.1 unnamed protein product [Rotaria magnacalcarata]CAF4153843.1 unnamed protein product [Rotaria magnacalcarata]CAF4168201.1 unnamed protein product [Rotaria magnacalcarata]